MSIRTRIAKFSVNCYAENNFKDLQKISVVKTKSVSKGIFILGEQSTETVAHEYIGETADDKELDYIKPTMRHFVNFIALLEGYTNTNYLCTSYLNDIYLFCSY